MSNNVYIIWEHFKSNYINQAIANDDDDDFDEDEEDADIGEDQEDGFGNLIKVSRMLQGPILEPHYTPWGAFHPNNPMSPVNMYDLYFAHFHGFTTFTIKNFKDLMNSIEGVAIWAQHDPYTIIFGPAKTYSATEVKINIEGVLMAAMGIPPKKSTSSELEDIKEQSNNMFQNGVSNIFIRFPNGHIDVIENPSQIFINEAMDLKTKIKDVVIYMNGESL